MYATCCLNPSQQLNSLCLPLALASSLSSEQTTKTMPYTYHLKFDIKIVKLEQVVDHQVLDGKIFVRYYIPTFNDRRIKVDTRDIQNKNNVLWDESASFECHTNFDQIIEQVDKSTHIAFELRSRRSKQVLGGIMGRSRLLGRGEVSWGNLVGSKHMKLEKWVILSAKGVKLAELPNLLVEMEVQVTRDVGLNEKVKCLFANDSDGVSSEIDIFHVETVVD